MVRPGSDLLWRRRHRPEPWPECPRPRGLAGLLGRLLLVLRLLLLIARGRGMGAAGQQRVPEHARLRCSVKLQSGRLSARCHRLSVADEERVNELAAGAAGRPQASPRAQEGPQIPKLCCPKILTIVVP